MELVAVLAMAFYLFAAFACVHNLLNPQNTGPRYGLLAAICALLLHGIWLYDTVVQVPGQNLSMLNVASIISLIISALMTVAPVRSAIRCNKGSIEPRPPVTTTRLQSLPAT